MRPGAAALDRFGCRECVGEDLSARALAFNSQVFFFCSLSAIRITVSQYIRWIGVGHKVTIGTKWHALSSSQASLAAWKGRHLAAFHL